MKRSWIGALALALALAASAGPLDAQQGPRRMGRVEMEQRIRARFAEMVRVQLGLTPGQQEAFAGIVREYQDRREGLVLREYQLRRRIGGVPLALAQPAQLLPDEEAREVLREMVAIQEEEARLLREEQVALLDVLSPGQLARFYGMREQLADRIRRLREGAGPGAGGGGAPGWR